MVATPIRPQQLSAREAPGAGGGGYWGTMQIAAPAIVGGGLLLLFALFVLYMLWRSRPTNRPSYSYQQVRTDWTSKIGRMLSTRWNQHKVRHSSAPLTLDDSMRTSGVTLNFSRWSRQNRSDSADSQTPLTSTYIDYPPNMLPESPPPPRRRRPSLRWWWLFGSRPKQVESKEPCQRWRVDGPDGSSTGHGHTDNGHGDAIPAVMAPLREEPEDGDEVINIGENFVSTPATQHFPDQLNLARGLSAIPEHPSSSGARMPIPIVSYSPSHPGTPVSTASRDLPPSYTRYPSSSSEDVTRLAQYGPYMSIAAPGRAAGYSSPRPSHGRELSSDSFLAAQAPMVVASMY